MRKLNPTPGKTYIKSTSKTSTLNLIRRVCNSVNPWAILALVRRFGVHGSIAKFPETLDLITISNALSRCRFQSDMAMVSRDFTAIGKEVSNSKSWFKDQMDELRGGAWTVVTL